MDKKELHDYHCSHERFSAAFIHYPHPFRRGDIVTRVLHRNETGTDIGIVATSQEEWGALVERVQNGQAAADEGDARLIVEWLAEDGHFWHSHEMPIFLERYAPEGPESPTYAMLLEASALQAGRGSLELFGVFARRKILTDRQQATDDFSCRHSICERPE